MRKWEKTVVSFYCAQVLKFSELRQHFSKGTDPTAYTSAEDLELALKLLEDESKEAAYQVRKMLPCTPAAPWPD